MAGFTVCISDSFSLPELESGSNIDACVFKGPGFACYNLMTPRFKSDKVFYEDDDFILILDGVVLNRLEILLSTRRRNWEECLIERYRQDGNVFFASLRGSFSGALLNKKSSEWVFFTDHLGSKFIYYLKYKNTFVVSSNISDLYKFLLRNNIPYGLDLNGAYLLLTYGYMLEDITLCNRIKKIQPGHYLVYENGLYFDQEYFTLDNTPNFSLKECDIIEKMDYHFRNATDSQFKKDKEYGINKHLVALSGGLDSRMTSWVAHDLGYKDQLNYTFSQTGYLDQTIPQSIAESLQHEWIFKSLDGGHYLFDVDEVVKITGGNVLYNAQSHVLSFTKYFNFETVGLMHSGQLGDVIFGTYSSSNANNLAYKVGDGAYSKILLDKLLDRLILQKNYQNQEIAQFYYRGLTGTNNGLVLNNEYSETHSPFMDLELLKFAFQVPVSLRHNHYIYKQWIVKKYPLAAKYIWERTGKRINERDYKIKIQSNEYELSKIISKISVKLLKHLFGWKNISKSNMNPSEYYYNSNKKLFNFINTYFNEGLEHINDSNLRSDLLLLYNSNDHNGKHLALTLLSAIRMYKITN